MRRTMQLLAVTCTAFFILSAATPAAAGPGKWWYSGGPSEEWASGRVSFSMSCLLGVPLVLTTLPDTFRLTDIVVGNPGAVATVVLQDLSGAPAGTPPLPTLMTRLTVVVPGGTTFTDSFRIALVLAAGDLTVLCNQNVYITLSGKLEGERDDD